MIRILVVTAAKHPDWRLSGEIEFNVRIILKHDIFSN